MEVNHMEVNRGGAGNASYDWAALEKAFVFGDIELVELSRERTGLAASPPYAGLRKRSARLKWKDMKKAEQAKQAMMPMTPEQRAEVAAEKEVVEQLETRIEKLMDASEVIADHLRLSKTLKGMYGALGVKVREAINLLSADKMTTGQVLTALNTLTNLVQATTDLERKSLGLAEPLQQIDVTTRYVISLDPQGQPKDLDEPLEPTLTKGEWASKYANN